MGVLGPDPPAPGEQGESWSMLRIRARVCYRPSKRGTEDGVRDDGGWAGDTWYRRGALSKAGGPRSVRVCRSLKGKGQRPGLAANHLVDTVSELKTWNNKLLLVVECGGGGAGLSIGRAGRVAGGDLHKSE
ncbi:hypothetical protein EVAR_91963_1 [Eumeta japonica]|uniref:Uncharacterized protein n=1 Tax=Eumeta variegata TaxID=151549 RepID=A0A4C1SBY3_EUMVA|nr:hypothetical protein EVAR_91963_1 [Eumeta japonica]